MKLLARARETADLVMFQHTVFALPFAVIALISAEARRWPPLEVWVWVVLAMVGARTAAMAFNRLVDQELDAENPRTAGRSLPAGRLGRPYVWGVVTCSSLLFMLAAAQLNRLCLILAGPTLAVLLGYSYAKRFTATAHLWLGLALGIAPIGAWVAVTGRLHWLALVLGTGVTLWVAGFDIIYSLQDEGFDRERGLHSIPARLGARGALWISRSLHLGALAAFSLFALAVGGGPLRLLAVAAALLLMLLQHSLVRPGQLERVNAAFFTANGVLSLLMCVLFLFAKMQASP